MQSIGRLCSYAFCAKVLQALTTLYETSKASTDKIFVKQGNENKSRNTSKHDRDCSSLCIQISKGHCDQA